MDPFFVLSGVTHWTRKSILDVKKISNLVKGIFTHNFCCGMESQLVKKADLSFSTKNF